MIPIVSAVDEALENDVVRAVDDGWHEAEDV